MSPRDVLYTKVIGSLALWLALMFLLLFSLEAKGEEAGTWYAMAGSTTGQEWLGSKQAEPSSAVAVLGWDSGRFWNDRVRLELEGQATNYWIGLATGVRVDLGRGFHAVLGTGAGVLDADLDWQSDGFNFLLQGGVGMEWRRLRVDVRLHHISNARLRQPNSGTNAVMVLLGGRW